MTEIIDEDVERAARALFEGDYSPCPWSSALSEDRDQYLATARAALLAALPEIERRVREECAKVFDRPHKLSVTRYHEGFRAHECKVIDAPHLGSVYVDLFVDGTFPENMTEIELVGKIVAVDYTHPFISIASNPRIDAAAIRKEPRT